MDAGQAAFVAALEARFRQTYGQFINYLAYKRDNRRPEANGTRIPIFSSEIDSMSAIIDHTWPHIMSGGADPTYKRPEIGNIAFLGNPLPPEGIPHEDNILIVGGGPSGLYMAYLLKAALQSDKWPNLHVSVLENRVDADGQRRMTRKQQISVASDYLVNQNKVSKVKQISDDLYETLYDLKQFSPDGDTVTVLDFVQPIKVNSNMFKIFGGRDCNRFLARRVYKTNVLEYELANLAQGIGVNIYHDAAMKRPEDIIAKYTNEKTLVLFDATGGRLFGFDAAKGFHKIREATESQKFVFRDALAHVGSFNVYEGFLPNEDSIKRIGELLCVAIGDTTFRVDYSFGRGLAISWALEFFYALQFAQMYKDYKPPLAGGSRTRGRRHRVRRTRRR